MKICLTSERPPLWHALTGHVVSTAFELGATRNLTLWTTSWPKIQRYLPEVAVAVNQLTEGAFVELSFP